MTNDTMPSYIWAHEVTLAAIRAGVSAEFIRDCQRARLSLWYQSGETIEGAVEMLRAFWVGAQLAEREDNAGLARLFLAMLAAQEEATRKLSREGIVDDFRAALPADACVESHPFERQIKVSRRWAAYDVAIPAFDTVRERDAWINDTAFDVVREIEAVPCPHRGRREKRLAPVPIRSLADVLSEACSASVVAQIEIVCSDCGERVS